MEDVSWSVAYNAKKEDQTEMKNVVGTKTQKETETDAQGVTWYFFLQASCDHCWSLIQESWGSDVLSVTERASVERHNDEIWRKRKRGKKTRKEIDVKEQFTKSIH